MPHCVLCVDDYLAGLRTIQKVLEHAGFQVSATTDTAAAVELARKNDFDAAVIDFQMPATDGAQLARMLKQERPKLPIVLITAYPASVPEDVVDWVDSFLCKGSNTARELPVLVEELIAAHLFARQETQERLRSAAENALAAGAEVTAKVETN